MQDTWCGSYYKHNSKPQEQAALSVIKLIDFKGNESVLDIGCGDGKITARIAQLIPQGTVIGIDISESMICAAQQSHGSINNLSFQVADAADFSCKQPYDYIVSFSTLHWVKKQVAAFKNIKQALKPGGTAIIRMTTPEKSPMYTAFDALNKTWPKAVKNRKEVFNGKTIAQIKEILKQAGFKNFTITWLKQDFYFEHCEKFVEWMMAWIPHTTKLDNKKAYEFAQDLAQIFYEQSGQDITGPFSGYFPFLHIELKNN